MTKLQKTVATSLVSVLALGALGTSVYAFDDDFKDGDKKEYRKDYDGKKHNRLSMIKGANLKFEGKIAKKPKGLNGVWTVGTQDIIVDDNTKIYQDDKQFEVGGKVEVIAQRINGQIKALIIKHDGFFQ